jgi:DNA-binding NarL/FixJ family response regulator
MQISLPSQLHRTFSLLLTSGSIKDIANDMNLDDRTICSYASTIYRRFGVGNRLALVLAVYRDKSVPQPHEIKKIPT